MNSTRRIPALLACLALSGCAARGPGDADPDPTTTNPVPAETAPGHDLAVIPKRASGPFPTSITSLGRNLELNGAGLCEWGIFGIDLYRAALYVERPGRDAEPLLTDDAGLVVIHLEFVRGLSKAQLTEAYTASVRENTGDRFTRFEQPLTEFVATLRAVEDGDTITCTSEPGVALHVQRNGTPVARIDDDAFRALFVRLYLGDKPPTKALRKALLGR